MSRLDRFLVSTDWIRLYPDVYKVALLKPALDHCPVMLDSNCERWGLAPFRFEMMRLEEKDFTHLISAWWNLEGISSGRKAGSQVSLEVEIIKNENKGMGEDKFWRCADFQN